MHSNSPFPTPVRRLTFDTPSPVVTAFAGGTPHAAGISSTYAPMMQYAGVPGGFGGMGGAYGAMGGGFGGMGGAYGAMGGGFGGVGGVGPGGMGGGAIPGNKDHGARQGLNILSNLVGDMAGALKGVAGADANKLAQVEVTAKNTDFHGL